MYELFRNEGFACCTGAARLKESEMEQREIEAQLNDLANRIRAAVNELVLKSPVVQNLLGQQSVLQNLLDSHEKSNGQMSTEEVLEEVA